MTQPVRVQIIAGMIPDKHVALLEAPWVDACSNGQRA